MCLEIVSAELFEDFSIPPAVRIGIEDFSIPLEVRLGTLAASPPVGKVSLNDASRTVPCAICLLLDGGGAFLFELEQL